VTIVAKKVVLIILGILLGICGIASICLGGVLLGIGGSSGSFHSDYQTIATTTVGFVSDPAHVENSQDTKVTGTGVTLKISAQNSRKPLFFGVGPTSQVDAYLSGSPYEHVTGIDFSPFKITSTRVAGTTQPAAPGDQSFWVAKATGTNPSLSWKIATGDYEAVLMNADGTRGFQADTRLGIDAPVLGKFAIGGLVVGILATIGGLAVLIWGIRTRRVNPAVTPAYPTGYGPAGVYPASGGTSGHYPPAAPTEEGYQPPAGYQPPPGYPPSGYETPGGGYTPPPSAYPPPPPPAPPPPPPPPPPSPPDDPTAPPSPPNP
jgi:hypothetical protein